MTDFSLLLHPHREQRNNATPVFLLSPLYFASCRDFGVRLRFTDTDVVRDYEFDGGFSRICKVNSFKNPLISGYT